MIEVNSAEAQKQATNLGIAGDKLTISQVVTFSEGTDVPGNAQSKATFESLKTAPTTIQQLLTRDVNNIHSAVASFKRADEQVDQLFNPSIIK